MTNFYVSSTGDDSHSGLDASTAFATLSRAQEAMRQSQSADTAFIAGGTYVLNNPLTLTSADSGSSFVAMSGQTPIISGGTAVTQWTQGSNGIWTARVDASEVLQLTQVGGGVVEVLGGQTGECFALHAEGGVGPAESLVAEVQVQLVHLVPGHQANEVLERGHRIRLAADIEHQHAALVVGPIVDGSFRQRR